MTPGVHAQLLRNCTTSYPGRPYLQVGMSLAGLLRLKHAVASKFGRHIANAFACISACQFHPLFYASRPLPNTFAGALVSWAMAELLLQKPEACISILTFTTVSPNVDSFVPA